MNKWIYITNVVNDTQLLQPRLTLYILTKLNSKMSRWCPQPFNFNLLVTTINTIPDETNYSWLREWLLGLIDEHTYLLYRYKQLEQEKEDLTTENTRIKKQLEELQIEHK